MPRRCIATSQRRCSMARKRASMREGPLAELFKATEAAQRQQEVEQAAPAEEPQESTVEHVPTWEDEVEAPAPPRPDPQPEPPAPDPVPDPVPERPPGPEPGAAPGPGAAPPPGGVWAGAAGHALHRADAGACAALASRARGTPRLVPREDPGGRCRRRGIERRQPDDRRRYQPGRVRRGEHRCAAAADLRCRNK